MVGIFINKKTIFFIVLILLVIILISISVYTANNNKPIKVLTGSSKDWEVHMYMQESVSTTVIVVPLIDTNKLPKYISTVIQCSDPSKGLVYQELSLASGNTYQSEFPTNKSLYQHSDDLRLVISQESGDETIILTTDKAWNS